MKTIQLSERELSIIFRMLTPPYPVRDTHTDEFNELRNKVFYALRDAQNDEPMQEQHRNAGLSKKCRRTEKMQVEPVSNRDELPDIVGWIRSDYHSDRRMGDAPIFILGCIDPSDVWGVKYIPLSGNSPVTSDGNCSTVGKALTITLPDTSSKAFWSGSGKTEVFHPETYKRWVKEAIERYCAIAGIEVRVK